MSNNEQGHYQEVYSYTREQAIQDGVLVDLSSVMKEHKMTVFKWPTACTSAVWETCIAWEVEDSTQDVPGRLWDVLTMALHAIKTGHDPSAQYRYFFVAVRGTDDIIVDRHLKIHCGPGDTAEPVMTIMMEDED